MIPKIEGWLASTLGHNWDLILLAVLVGFGLVLLVGAWLKTTADEGPAYPEKARPHRSDTPKPFSDQALRNVQNDLVQLAARVNSLEGRLLDVERHAPNRKHGSQELERSSGYATQVPQQPRTASSPEYSNVGAPRASDTHGLTIPRSGSFGSAPNRDPQQQKGQKNPQNRPPAKEAREKG
ncbi:MAG: hypothetical protein ACK4YP_10175, partial [Myxococcota bacterium]